MSEGAEEENEGVKSTREREKQAECERGGVGEEQQVEPDGVNNTVLQDFIHLLHQPFVCV